METFVTAAIIAPRLMIQEVEVFPLMLSQVKKKWKNSKLRKTCKGARVHVKSLTLWGGKHFRPDIEDSTIKLRLIHLFTYIQG